MCFGKVYFVISTFCPNGRQLANQIISEFAKKTTKHHHFSLAQFYGYWLLESSIEDGNQPATSSADLCVLDT